MNTSIVLLSCLACLLISCKKDSEIKEAAATRIIISDASPLVAVTDINPDATVQSWSGEAFYNLDIDKDGVTDFIFKANNSFGCAAAMYNINLNIETANSSSYILCDSIYPAFNHNSSNGITTTAVDPLFPKVMSLNDTIDISQQMEAGKCVHFTRLCGQLPAQRKLLANWEMDRAQSEIHRLTL